MNEPELGRWLPASTEVLRTALLRGRVPHDDLDSAVDSLLRAGLVVFADYYVPTTDELYRDYATLGEAYLQGRIKVRWVMCAETHDALYQRYRDRRYASSPWFPTSFDPQPGVEVIEHAVRTVMEGNLRWSDEARLFGIPIRLDPAARRPMFEMAER